MAAKENRQFVSHDFFSPSSPGSAERGRCEPYLAMLFTVKDGIRSGAVFHIGLYRRVVIGLVRIATIRLILLFPSLPYFFFMAADWIDGGAERSAKTRARSGESVGAAERTTEGKTMCKQIATSSAEKDCSTYLSNRTFWFSLRQSKSNPSCNFPTPNAFSPSRRSLFPLVAAVVAVETPRRRMRQSVALIY